MSTNIRIAALLGIIGLNRGLHPCGLTSILWRSKKSKRRQMRQYWLTGIHLTAVVSTVLLCIFRIVWRPPKHCEATLHNFFACLKLQFIVFNHSLTLVLGSGFGSTSSVCVDASVVAGFACCCGRSWLDWCVGGVGSCRFGCSCCWFNVLRWVSIAWTNICANMWIITAVTSFCNAAATAAWGCKVLAVVVEDAEDVGLNGFAWLPFAWPPNWAPVPPTSGGAMWAAPGWRLFCGAWWLFRAWLCCWFVAVVWGFGILRMSMRQVGQVCCLWNQERKHDTWNIWLQGSFFDVPLPVISSRHIIQTLSVLANSSGVAFGYSVFIFLIALRDIITSHNAFFNVLKLK